MILRPAILPAMILTIKTPQAAGVLRPGRLGAAVRSAKRTEPIPPDAPPSLDCLRTSIPDSGEIVERLARKIGTADERGKNCNRSRGQSKAWRKVLWEGEAPAEPPHHREACLSQTTRQEARPPLCFVNGYEKEKTFAFIRVHLRTKK